MRRLYLALGLLSVVPVVLAINACGDEESVLPLAAPDASPDLNVPDGATGIDATVPADSGPKDAATIDAGPCPIADDATVTATIKVTADDYLRLWVNGELVDDKATTWQAVDTKTVTLFRNPARKNVIAVEARNAFNAGGFDRGLLLDLGFDAGPDAGIPGVVTDPSWKIIGTLTDGGLPASGLPDGGTNGVAGWFDTDFDDSSWHAPVDEGPHGMGPWGAVFGASTARWLWSYNSSTAGSKPSEEFVYYRKVFYLDTSGAPKDAPPSCP